MKNLSRKITITLVVIVSFFISTNYSLASDTKNKLYKPSAAELFDPDLNLSIAELKKKYPIDWLQKRNLGDYEMDEEGYSIAQLKSIFLHADENFIKKSSNHKGEVEVKSRRELEILSSSCDFYRYYNRPETGPLKRQKLAYFLFSKKMVDHVYPYVSEFIQHCLTNPIK